MLETQIAEGLKGKQGAGHKGPCIPCYRAHIYPVSWGTITEVSWRKTWSHFCLIGKTSSV